MFKKNFHHWNLPRSAMVIQLLSLGLYLEGFLPPVFKLCYILWAEGLDNIPRSFSVLEHWYPSKYLSFPVKHKHQFKKHSLISPSSFFFPLLPACDNVCVHTFTHSHGFKSCTELRLQKLYIQSEVQIKMLVMHNTNF